MRNRKRARRTGYGTRVAKETSPARLASLLARAERNRSAMPKSPRRARRRTVGTRQEKPRLPAELSTGSTLRGCRRVIATSPDGSAKPSAGPLPQQRRCAEATGGGPGYPLARPVRPRSSSGSRPDIPSWIRGSASLLIRRARRRPPLRRRELGAWISRHRGLLLSSTSPSPRYPLDGSPTTSRVRVSKDLRSLATTIAWHPLTIRRRGRSFTLVFPAMRVSLPTSSPAFVNLPNMITPGEEPAGRGTAVLQIS